MHAYLQLILLSYLSFMGYVVLNLASSLSRPPRRIYSAEALDRRRKRAIARGYVKTTNVMHAPPTPRTFQSATAQYVPVDNRCLRLTQEAVMSLEQRL